MKRQFSLQGKFLFLNLFLVIATLILSAAAFSYFPYWWALSLLSVILIPVAFYCSNAFISPIIKLIKALTDATDNIRDQDFSVTIANKRSDELGNLVQRYNEIGDLLREERYNLNQRELLLDTVLQSTPVAMWLCDDRQHIVYANIEARQLLLEGKRVVGIKLENALKQLDEELAKAINAEREGLVSIESDGEIETYYLSCRFFSLNGRLHRLHLVRSMTREISRQEVNTWKRVIRVISHELNNSLAPISSLSYSGGLMMNKLRPEELSPTKEADWKKLANILTTIGERSSHLKNFIEGYASFARLPLPKIESFNLFDLLERLSSQLEFIIIRSSTDLMVSLDQTQFEQVLINLIKNARDASGSKGRIEVSFNTRHKHLLMLVSDDGPGMSHRVMQQALLPFYSTKQEGTGLGLPLCREIIEAHGGQLSLSNRKQGGLDVQIKIPENITTIGG